jgi:hypothetical protein
MSSFFQVKSSYWRLRAEETRMLAETMTTNRHAYGSMLRIADEYERLADMADRKNARNDFDVTASVAWRGFAAIRRAPSALSSLASGRNSKRLLICVSSRCVAILETGAAPTRNRSRVSAI